MKLLATHKRRRITTLLMVGVLSVGTAACVGAAASSRPTLSSDKVCKSVDAKIVSTNKQIRAQKAKAKAGAGTPNEANAKEALKTLTDQLHRLQATKSACDAAKAKSTTTTSKKSRKSSNKKSPKKGGATSASDCIVTNQDGTQQVLPAVGGCSPNAHVPPIGMAASNASPQTPPVNQSHQLLNSWCDLEQRFSAPGFQWYRDGVLRTAHVTWQEVHAYCRMQKVQHVDARVILVNGGNPISDASARAMMAKEGVVNANRLKVVRYGSIINTRGMRVNQMNEFVDTRSMVRVFLAPMFVDAHGKVTSLDPTRGVFVDCTNAMRVLVNVQPLPPSGVPPAPGPTSCFPYVPFQGRCVKPASDDGHGGNQSRNSQPVSQHPQGIPPGVGGPPPPAYRPPGDKNGGSGSGGAPPTSSPPDTSHSKDTTPPTTACGVDPFGNPTC